MLFNKRDFEPEDGDWQAFAKALEAKAKAGDIDARNTLGVIHEGGFLGECDLVEAFTQYMLAYQMIEKYRDDSIRVLNKAEDANRDIVLLNLHSVGGKLSHEQSIEADTLTEGLLDDNPTYDASSLGENRFFRSIHVIPLGQNDIMGYLYPRRAFVALAASIFITGLLVNAGIADRLFERLETFLLGLAVVAALVYPYQLKKHQVKKVLFLIFLMSGISYVAHRLPMWLSMLTT